MPDPNPITTAREALQALLPELVGMAKAQRHARAALAALGVLDHEAAVEEWRCPMHPEAARRHGGTCELPCGEYGEEDCQQPLRRVLVVPFRSEGGDHADA